MRLTFFTKDPTFDPFLSLSGVFASRFPEGDGVAEGDGDGDGDLDGSAVGLGLAKTIAC